MTWLATAGRPAEPARRCWTLVSVDGAVDVEVTARDDERLARVLTELTACLGLPADGLWSGSRRLPDDTALSAPELRHGAVLGLGRPARRSPVPTRSSALELHVVGGPHAGLTMPLGRGRLVLGRGGDAAVRLDDPDVSRRHAEVSVGAAGITVADLGSTNGTTLGAEALAERPRRWSAGEVLRLGASALTVNGPDPAPAAVEHGPGGRLRLRPSAPGRPPMTEVEVPLPRRPEPPPRRRLAWVTIALPAVGGVLMALVLHTPTFLFFALLSPVVGLGTWLSERSSGRRTARRDAVAHAMAMLQAEERIAAAVRQSVQQTESAVPDLASLTTAARRRSRLLWGRTRSDADALVIRLGCGPGSTTVTRVRDDGTRVREVAAHMPVSLDLRAAAGLAVVGPRERSLGVLFSAVAQLVALHPPGEVDLLLLVAADRLGDWTWARWLPHLSPAAVQVVSDPAAPAAAGAGDALNARLTAAVRQRRAVTGAPGSAVPVRPGWLVVVADGRLDTRVATILREAADAGVVTLTAAESLQSLPVPVETTLRLSGETGDIAVLSRPGVPDRGGIIVDRLARPVAADLARDLAALAPVSLADGLPTSVRLLDLPRPGRPPAGSPDPAGPNAADPSAGGTWSAARDRLVATLGRTADGPLRVDLCRQGPHALIAGTTGSGKSELLQTLIAGLALAHPPDRCSFLLVDYKGGAAFAEASALPHTVGLVTDLDGGTTARALRSLTAELARREAILGAHQVADIADLPESIEVARLVIVVDEFATLVDDLPDFVPGLVSIAQRGRSLGVHLVLATQRPAGVVSPEIRANCTLRICLRTTDEADSRDILGVPDAAFLPVDLPGRAFLRSGSGEPTLLQVARVSTATPRSTTAPAVRRWAWPAVPATPDAPPREGDSDLSGITGALLAQAAARAAPLPHRPWRPPLPDQLPWSALEATVPKRADAPPRLRIGLLDLPHRQEQVPLELDLAEGGSWLVVGGPRSGRTTLLRTVLGEAVSRLGPDRLHVHVLESTGGPLAAEAAALPHTGTAIGGQDGWRTLRLIDRLAEQIAARRSSTAVDAAPLLLLLIDGIEAVSSLLEEADPGRGSDHLFRLLREGAAAGLTCVLTADRAVPGGRLAAVARQRLLLPLPDRADYAVAGIPGRALPAHRPPGRALLGEDALECHIALPRPLPEVAAVPRRAGTAPLRIVELPREPFLPLPTPPSTPGTPAGDALRLPLGPGGDEGEPLVIDLYRTGGLVVVGPPGSGRTTALRAFARHLVAAGSAVLTLGRPGCVDPSPPSRGTVGLRRVEPTDEAALDAWILGLAGRPGVVIADDVGAPGDAPALNRLPRLGSPGSVALLAAGTAGQLSGHFQGPIATLRRARTGLLLCPGPGDADLLGIRLPRTRLPVRPGCGWLISGGHPQRVQIAQRPDRCPDRRPDSPDGAGT